MRKQHIPQLWPDRALFMHVGLFQKYKNAFLFSLLAFFCSQGHLGAQLTVITANQQGALPLTPTWVPATDSLIANEVPGTAEGNFSEEVSGRNVNSLTAGVSLSISQITGNDGTTCSTNYVTCGNGYGAGSLLIYSLPASANGYNVTNITVYGGWQDNGRDQQAYTVYYATAQTPSDFIQLTNVNYLPSVPSGTASATQVVIANATGGAIATNVVAVEFNFTSPGSENGYCGYAAITIQGTISGPPTGPPIVNAPQESPSNANVGISPGTTVNLTASGTGLAPIGYQWRTDGGSGGGLTNIPGATASTLAVSTTGLAAGTYLYDYVATNSIGTNISAAATIAIDSMTDIGANAPTPGAADISQLLNASQSDDGINYYTDNGASYGNWCGQTFTTGNNPNGYLLKSFTWKSAGNGSNFGTTQLYDLYLYSVSPDGSRATLIASYQGNGGGTENDWFAWQGLNVPLAPNQVYAYAFGHDASGGGWEHIGDQGGNPYSGGQIMTVTNTSGTGNITYGLTGTSDATFDLALVVYEQQAPRALMPTVASGTYPVYAGTSGTMTLNETALGSGTLSYQWLTDNGTGAALTPISGASGTNLTISLSSLSAQNYNYAVEVCNKYGSSVSQPLTLNVLGPSAPSISSDITPQPVDEVNVGQTASFSAMFTGTPPINYQWYFDTGSGPNPISAGTNPAAVSNTLVIANVQLTNAGIYSVVAQNSAGSTSSSDSSLLVIPPAGTPPPAVTLPPVTLHITPNGPNNANLLWAQSTLLESTNLFGPWIPVSESLEPGNYLVATTNPAMFFKAKVASQPRIVDIYCFARDQDSRIANSQQVLFNTTTQEVQLVEQANLPATFALQYDALMDTNYQNFFKNVGTNIEIAGWYEIPQELVQAAGLTWNGSSEWDPNPNVDFSCGYTPSQRTNLVDAYMAGFKSVFGYYPKTVGSWYIDAISLSYMASKYGVTASCNCKDQFGTDTYTLWGGYWNQAYYPSRINAYMPAQTPAGQINMPIFRMLGSDPIYQYGGNVITLEPVYSPGGGSEDWVTWFINNLINEPSLAFAWTQAGQENDIDNSWSSIGPGLTRQVSLFAAEQQAGRIQLQKFSQTGQWFRSNYAVTPPTAVVALNDWQNQGRKSVWYDSRCYRLNLVWDFGTFYIRDLHCFDQNVASPTYTNVLTTTYCNYQTLPVMDGEVFSGSGTNSVGMWPILLLPGENVASMMPVGHPVVKETDPNDLSIQQTLSGGGTFSIICSETNVICTALNSQGQPLSWAWDLVGGSEQSSAVQNVSSNAISYLYGGASYQLQIPQGAGTCQQLSNGILRLLPNAGGQLIVSLDVDN